MHYFLSLFLLVFSCLSLTAQVNDSIPLVVRDTVFVQKTDTLYLTVKDTIIEKVKIQDTTVLTENIIVERRMKKRKQTSKMYGRWVYSLIFTPGISLFSQLQDAEGNALAISRNDRFLTGLRFEKYFPNTAYGYGAELDFMERNVIIEPAPGSVFAFIENTASFSPFINLKRGRFDKTFHPTVEIGLRNEYIMDSKVSYADNDITGKINNSVAVNSYRLWTYIGLGWKRDAFNQSGSIINSRRTKAGLSSLQVKFFFSVFNQANIFRDSGVTFPAALSSFRKSKFFETFATLSYTHNLDWKSNILSQYNVPGYLSRNKSDIFIPPLINTNKSRRGFQGNLFLEHELVSPGMDSVFVTTGQDTTIFNTGRNIANAGNFTFGYTLHFIGNHKKFINESTGRSVERRGFSWDLFVKAGYNMRNYRLSSLRLAQLTYQAIEGTGGIRLGRTPPGLHLILGYTYSLNVKKEFLLFNKTVSNFKFSNQTVHIPFVGIGIRNNFYILLRYRYDMENLKVEKGFLDNVGVTIGFGG